MSIELKQAAQQAIEALIEARRYVVGAYECAFPDRDLNESVIRQIDETVTAIQQAEAQQPATGEPVLVQHRKPIEGLTGETIGYTAWIDGKGLEWWPHRELYDHPAPGVPDGYVTVPLQVLHDASDALGNFIMDHGWGDADMQAMDNLDAYIARHEANRAAMLAAK